MGNRPEIMFDRRRNQGRMLTGGLKAGRTCLFAVMLLAAIQTASVWGQTLDASRAALPGSVNTNLPGFKVRFVQGNNRFPLGSLAAAEALLAGRAVNATTGAPIPDTSIPGPEKGGYYHIPGAFNWHERAQTPGVAGGLFSSTSVPPGPDQPLPGAIPGSTGSSDYFVMEATGFMDLPAGTVRLGVNSDDGFRLTVGTGLNPSDPFAPLTLIEFARTRTFASSEAVITVPQAGVYPFRILWFENTGTNAGFEFYSQSSSGERLLVNDPAQPQSIKVYREAVGGGLEHQPLSVDPPPGAVDVVASPLIRVEIIEGTAGPLDGSLRLEINGRQLAHRIERSGNKVVASASAGVLISESLQTASLIYANASGVLLTNNWSFTTAGYVVVPSEFSVPDVDRSVTGFKLRSYQMPQARGPIALGLNGNGLAQVERALAGGYLDPATGRSYTNLAQLAGIGDDGYFAFPRSINLSQTAGGRTDFGNFQNDLFPPVPDEPVPGISTNADHFVVEIRAYISLKAGAHRFGVNSDEGFKLSVSRSTGDLFGLVLGQFSGSRSGGETLMDFVVEKDGLYPFRLIWWDGTGTSSCEFFGVDTETGNKILINDPGSPYQAFQVARTVRPHVGRVLPADGAVLVFPTAEVMAEIRFGTLPVDRSSVSLSVNGEVGGSLRESDGGLILAWRRGVGDPLPAGTNTARLAFSYSEEGVVNRVTNNWSFVVGGTTGAQELAGGSTPPSGPGRMAVPYVRIPAGNRVEPGVVDLSKPGFKILRTHQLDRSQDGLQAEGGRLPGAAGNGNRMPRPEIQLSGGYINRTHGLPFPNLSSRNGFNADGTFDVAGVFDFSQFGTNSGAFNPTQPMPGMPGQGSSPRGVEAGSDNFVMEAVTYLELKAGSHMMSVNSDDGFLLTSAPNPRDTLGTIVGYLNDTGGSSAVPARWFSFVIPEDGIYPFRLLYWEGGGSASVEWLTIEEGSGQVVLVNDRSSAASVKAYREYLGKPKPWVKFSVYPMPGRWDNVHQQSGPGFIPVVAGAGVSAEWGNGPTLGIRPFADGIGAIFEDAGQENIGMEVNGAPVVPQITRTGAETLVSYRPGLPLGSGSTNVASLIYSGVTNSWTFVTQNYVELPDSLSPAGRVGDPAAAGFRVRVKKMKDGTVGVVHTVARAEDHLRGVVQQPDTAVPGPEPDGAYLMPGVINWNQEMRGGNGVESGNFVSGVGYPDDPIPGVGSGTLGEPEGASDLISAEVFTYLDLPKGYVKLGVNSDEGFRVTAATGYEARPLVLGTFAGAKTFSDVPFSFFVIKPGLYPIRLVWFEGTGSSGLEFFSYGPDNEKIPINAPGNPNAIRAYHRLMSSLTPEVSIEQDAKGIRVVFKGRLQSTRSLLEPRWEDVSGAVSPFEVRVLEGQIFYRSVVQ